MKIKAIVLKKGKITRDMHYIDIEITGEEIGALAEKKALEKSGSQLYEYNAIELEVTNKEPLL